MTLRVSGKNLAIGEALRTHVHDRIDAVTSKYHAGSPVGHVTIEPEGSGFRADCTLFLKSGMTLHVEAISQEPYSTFDKAADRIERRLRDHRKRLTGRHAEPVAGDPIGASLAEALELPPAAAEDDAIEGDTYPVVIAEHALNVREMTVAAAVSELESSSVPAVVFRYAENRRINVVYRRADGNIGWLDPLGGTNGHGS